MHKVMTLAAALLLSGAAWADQPSALPGNTNPSVGVGMICNTDAEAERYVALRADGSEIKAAAQRVNAEANDPRACGLAAIAFIPDKTMSSRAVGEKLVQVVRVNVIAGFNGAGWQHVAGMIQYAVIEAKGESI